MARIYVASSWRNAYFPEVVKRLREYGHEVYDFRNPPQGGHGFHWTDIDPNCAEWTFAEYADGLTHPAAEKQFAHDIEALEWADTCVLVLPCGRSAHTEAGWCKGRGMKTIVYIPKMEEPELMYKLFDAVTDSNGSFAITRYKDFIVFGMTCNNGTGYYTYNTKTGECSQTPVVTAVGVPSSLVAFE